MIFSYELLKGGAKQWDDLPEYRKLYEKNEATYPTAIYIWYGAFMDKMQVEYDGIKMPKHGDSEPGGYTKMSFEKGEYIVKVGLNYMPYALSSHMITEFQIETSKGKKVSFHAWWDYEKEQNYTHVEFKVPENCAVVAFGGTEESWNSSIPLCVAGITVHYKKIKED